MKTLPLIKFNYNETLEALKKFDENGHLLKECSVFFLRNYSIENSQPLVKYQFYEVKMKAKVALCEFDQIVQTLLNPQSDLYKTNPHIIVFSLYLDLYIQDIEEAEWNGKNEFSKIIEVLLLLEEKVSCSVAITNFVRPSSSKKLNEKIKQMNLLLESFIEERYRQFFLIDLENIVQKIGEKESFDMRLYRMFKTPFKPRLLNAFAYKLAGLGLATRGMAKKMIVVDADNTLWGGIIGEDGMDGILLHPDKEPGKSFYDFHKNLLSYKEKGFLLAISSKNNFDDVIEVLDKHPHCLLSKEDFVSLKINWSPKSQTISKIAEEINIGIDSIVFIDDNPTECAIIEEHLPEVEVLQVPEDVSLLPLLLPSFNFFQKLYSSAEDKNRTMMYQNEGKRSELKKEFHNIDKFLKSLGIKTIVQEVKDESLDRVAQLTQRTNQFNSATLRMTRKDVEEYVKKASHWIFTLEVSDKFGDYGLTGVIFVRQTDHQEAIIDNILLSCRILGKNIEHAFLSGVLNCLQKKYAIKNWKFLFSETSKNKPVEKFWTDIISRDVLEKNQKEHELTLESINLPDISLIEVTGL